MEKIIQNPDNIKEHEVTEVQIRVKGLIINSKNEILLGYSYNVYQFPGGHVENEDLNVALKREILEETGITLKKNYYPFACFYGYYKNYPGIGKNRKNEIYYYEIRIDDEPELNNTSYTKDEMMGNFELRRVPLDKVEEILIKNKEDYPNKKGITNEMLQVMEIYKNKKIM